MSAKAPKSPWDRLERWADRLLKVKERKLVILFATFVAVVIGLGTAWDKSQPFVRLFKSASTDASEVAKIRKDVEHARDEIAVISRDANNAQVEIKKLSALSAEAKRQADEVTEKTAEITSLQIQANEAVARMKATSDFSFLLARAASDDRKAFDELIRYAEQEGDFHDLAVAAISRIAGDLGMSLRVGTDWDRLGIDPSTIEFDELRVVFNARPTFDKPSILSEMWRQERFSKFERLSFLYDVIRSTDSVLVLEAACRAMDEEAKIHNNLIGYRNYLNWWREHGAEYAKVKDWKPNEDLIASDPTTATVSTGPEPANATISPSPPVP